MIVFPGYVGGWALDLFDFRRRQPIVRLGIGLILSFAISPIVLDLTSSLLSIKFSIFILGIIAIAFGIIVLKEKRVSTQETKRNSKTIFWIAGVWAIFIILSLMDIQWKDQLYFSMVSFDQTTRVSVIDAMTRTGIPPVNPSYYPGGPVKLTFLYYFWYILGSAVEMIGGRYIDARAALNASSAWAGLGLMATVAFYLRQRNANSGAAAWMSARIGISLLAVSGLRVILFIPILASGSKDWNILQLAILIWNNLLFAVSIISTWVASILWVQNHIAGLIAGISTIMLAQSARGKTVSKQFATLTVAGFGFASAFGLSVWVTLVFVIFWGAWLVTLSLQRAERNMILPMVFTGIVALILASPFLLGLFQGGGTGTGQFPIIFDVYTPAILKSFVDELPSALSTLVKLVILPISYFFDLGFFFIAGIIWFKIKSKEIYRSNPFYLTEILLLAIAAFIGSFVASTISNNDLGFRSWLPCQFVLLVWGVDVVESLLFKNSAQGSENNFRKIFNTKILLQSLIAIGILGTVMDALFLRTFWPIWGGFEFGQQTYSARLAYDYLRDHVPADVITQNNPLNVLDRPSGLYGTHQMAISDRTAYGVPVNVLQKSINEIGILFTNANATNWHLTDNICRAHAIDLLIINDTDPLWSSLPALKIERPPIYENAHYALYTCGNYATKR